MKYAVAIFATLILTGCSDADGAKRILQAQGYKEVQITGYRWFGGCGQNDNYRTGFRAIAPGGTNVEGVVCSGISPFGKSSTIRID